MPRSYKRRLFSICSNKSLLAEKLVEEAHLQTTHGGVTLAMAKIRDQYWIPILRQLVKRIIKKCYGCKRFNITHYPKPSQGLIPTDRTKQDLPFSVIWTDYAGPFICKTKGKGDIKDYLLLSTCNLTRGVHLEILSNKTTQEFIYTAWKVSKCGVFSGPYFRIQENTNQKKLRIWTLFMQWQA